MTADARNAAVTLVLFGSFAALCTAHIAAVFGIAKQTSYGRAAGAFVFPPLAPVFAFVGGMRVRAVIWCLFAAAYLAALFMARWAW